MKRTSESINLPTRQTAYADLTLATLSAVSGGVLEGFTLRLNPLLSVDTVVNSAIAGLFVATAYVGYQAGLRELFPR